MKGAIQIVTNRASVIDRYGELDRRVQEFAPVKNEHEKLKKQIKSWYDDAPAEETAVAEGSLYSIQVGARAEERTFKSLPAVVKALGGIKQFFKVIDVIIGKVEELLGEEKTAELLDTKSSGSRRLTAVAKSSPAVAQAA